MGSKCSLEKANSSRQSTSKASERSALVFWEWLENEASTGASGMCQTCYAKAAHEPEELSWTVFRQGN